MADEILIWHVISVNVFVAKILLKVGRQRSVFQGQDVGDALGMNGDAIQLESHTAGIVVVTNSSQLIT